MLFSACAKAPQTAVTPTNAPTVALPTAAPTPVPTPVPTTVPTPVPAESEYYRDSRMLVYANYIAEKGLGVQAGDEVLISAPVYTSAFVDLVSEACYARGARAVNVVYRDTARAYSAMRHLSKEDYDELVFDSALVSYLSVENSSVRYLSVVSPSFTLEAPSAELQAQYAEAQKEFIKSVKDFSKSEFPADKSWCIVTCANADWAKKVYPDLGDAEALSKLWEDIFSFVYIDKTSATGSVAETRIRELDERAKALTEMGVESLHFVGGDTDVTVRLHQPYRFQGSSIPDTEGIHSLPNIPSEECFTIPEKTGVNGKVAASRPLVLGNGTVIENMRLTFVDGYLTEWSADTGKDKLDAMLETENARYLGEVSIVSANSPIFKSGNVYYHTLLDENAACHMAFGDSYIEYNLPDGVEPDDQCNVCDVHVDFMFGTEDMEITATLLDGTQTPIMRNGVWAF
ncbi:MAG: aminopeptidase [Eubacteriales bacterium]|nr:aminopeptidase [Eubacteriales bacterium]